MKDFIQDIAIKQAHRKASLIDEHLARFLTEQGFQTTPWTAEVMKGVLKTNGYELIQEVERNVASETHIFKLVKVYKSTALTIPNPEFTICTTNIKS